MLCPTRQLPRDLERDDLTIPSHLISRLKLIVVLLSGIASHSCLDRLSRLGRRALDARRRALLRRRGSLVRHAVRLDALHALGALALIGSHVDVVAAIVADEVRQVLDGAGAGVVDGVVLGA